MSGLLDRVFTHRGGACFCGQVAVVRLNVQLREIDSTGSFFKGGRSVQRSETFCEEHGALAWEYMWRRTSRVFEPSLGGAEGKDEEERDG